MSTSTERYRRNKAQNDARARAWRAANPDKVVAYNRKYRQKTPAAIAKIVAYNKVWREKNPGYTAAKAAERRSRLRKTAPWNDAEIMRTIYLLAKAYSGAGVKCHVDHIIPLKGKAVSGLHVHTNLTLLPAQENNRKGNRYEGNDEAL